MRRQRGFTLTELIITLVVGAILVALAVPSFREMAKNNRLVTETNSVVADLQVARSEAAKRSYKAIFCSSSNPMAASPACGGTFATGWFVFIDADNSGAYSTGDTIIRRRDGPPSSVTIGSNATNNKITFDTTGGLPSGASAVTITVCDDRGTSYGREIDISVTGRPDLTVGTSGSPLSACL